MFDRGEAECVSHRLERVALLNILEQANQHVTEKIGLKITPRFRTSLLALMTESANLTDTSEVTLNNGLLPKTMNSVFDALTFIPWSQNQSNRHSRAISILLTSIGRYCLFHWSRSLHHRQIGLCVPYRAHANLDHWQRYSENAAHRSPLVNPDRVFCNRRPRY